MEKIQVFGQPSWRIASDCVEAFVTELGGHLAPVVFDRKQRKIQPYSIAPWAEERLDPSIPPILRVLRGDFFCMPFGGNATPYRGERHLIHGETANARWKFRSMEKRGEQADLHLSLKTKIRKGHVDKKITLIDGHNAIYSRHVISGMQGPMNFGQHATLRFPNHGIISTSRFVYGQVFPEMFELPENGGYMSLKPGYKFKSLRGVLTRFGNRVDLSQYPARRGFEDLVMLVSDPRKRLGWTAVTFQKERYVWFALKDTRILSETILWISNGGRHYPPWNGRHVNVMGLEEVTSYFHTGLYESVSKNSFSEKGYHTCVHLVQEQPFVVNYIMAVQPIPSGFDRVVSIREAKDKKGVTLISSSGESVKAKLEVEFLFEKSLFQV